MSQDPRPMPTILVVDDQSSMRLLLRDYLTASGFRVIVAENGAAALAAAGREAPDLVLLDVMMPHMDGLTFLRAFRAASRAPVILLTARMEESDKVAGLELGADDYVTKPFGMRELVARIRAALRRAEPAAPSGAASAGAVLRAADIELDTTRRTVAVAGRTVRLTASEFDLLALLMRSPGRVFRRRELLEGLQGPLAAGVARTVDVHVRNLRAKIEPDAARPQYVVTAYGVGYAFDDSGDARTADRRPASDPEPSPARSAPGDSGGGEE